MADVSQLQVKSHLLVRESMPIYRAADENLGVAAPLSSHWALKKSRSAAAHGPGVLPVIGDMDNVQMFPKVSPRHF